MYVDAWKETFERAELQGKPVLFTPNHVLPDTVPEKWFRYELRGRGRDFEVPRYLEKEVAVDFAGTVLSPERFVLNHSRLNIEGDFERLHEAMTVSDFCKAQYLPEPQDARKYIPRPASREENEAGVFFAMKPEQDAALGVVGHVRIDFGYQGKQFHHSWWPRGPEEMNTPGFKAELGKVVDELRRGPLKSLQDMRRFCHANGGEINGGMLGQNYGYVIETERYKYFLRCNPVEGDYQAYLTAMDKQAQEVGIGQKQKTEMKMTMSAPELVRAAWALRMLSANLIAHLAGECGACDGKCGSCDGECPYSKADFSVDIKIPEEFREIAGIPDDAVLHVEFPAEGGILVCESTGDQPELWDVPAPMMGELLAAGVCPASLEILLKSGEAVYGE